MSRDEVSIRELRNHGGDVVERVLRGERLVVTRAGEPVAELRPLPKRSDTVAALIEKRRHIARVDPDRLRRDVDGVIDTSL
jgi:prevent-host-death family protein